MKDRSAGNQPCIDLIIPSALGDALISTAVVRWLLENGRFKIKVTAWAEHSWLFGAFAEHPNFEVRLGPGSAPRTAVDLVGYLRLLPHRRRPRKHHVLSMLEVLRGDVSDLGACSEEFVLPRLDTNAQDNDTARRAFSSLQGWAAGRPYVWLCGRSTTPNRNPGHEFWTEVARMLAPHAAVVELLGARERPIDTQLIRGVRLNPLAAGSFMKHCAAGIAVDTFGLHLAAACGFSRVAVVLGSSHPACVCYPGNRPVYRVSPRTRPCQPCGNHGYVNEDRILETMPEVHGPFRSENRCLFREALCLKNLAAADVVSAVRRWTAMPVTLP